MCREIALNSAQNLTIVVHREEYRFRHVDILSGHTHFVISSGTAVNDLELNGSARAITWNTCRRPGNEEKCTDRKFIADAS